MRTDINHKNHLQLIDQVDALNEEVKVLALNLAIYLAKAKGGCDQIDQLESDFIRLVNGTVKVVRELAGIINVARNRDRTVTSTPPNSEQTDRIEVKLRSILDQCSRIMNSLSRTENLSLKPPSS